MEKIKAKLEGQYGIKIYDQGIREGKQFYSIDEPKLSILFTIEEGQIKIDSGSYIADGWFDLDSDDIEMEEEHLNNIINNQTVNDTCNSVIIKTENCQEIYTNDFNGHYTSESKVMSYGEMDEYTERLEFDDVEYIVDKEMAIKCELENIEKQWFKDFKAYLIEDWESVADTYTELLQWFIKDFFPNVLESWAEEDKPQLLEYQERFLALNNRF